MSEYQITYWRDLPSLVVARDGDNVTKAPLAQRFQEAIDEAAMRLGAIDADAYLAGWTRADWTSTAETPTEACERLVAELEADWSDEKLTAYLDAIGPAQA